MTAQSLPKPASEYLEASNTYGGNRQAARWRATSSSTTRPAGPQSLYD
jgi:hypothetical protein